MDKNKMVFINGFFSKDVPDNAPKFIMGKGSLHIGNLMQWLQENRYADFVNNGYINYEIRKSDKTGKRYIMVDTYKKQGTQTHAEGPETIDMQKVANSMPKYDESADKALLEEIPF